MTTVRWSIVQGDALERLRDLPAASFDACFCDPPYGLDFMGAEWDHAVPGPDLWREVLRVLRPGGHVLAFGGSRLWHRLAVALEDAGAEIRDTYLWLYGTGYPKSLDISKAIDRRRFDREDILLVTAWIRDARDAAGLTNRDIDQAFALNGMAGHWTSQLSQPAVPTLDQVPRLLDLLKVAEPPVEISRLLLDLNGRKGQPGEAWLRREVVGSYMGKDTKLARPVSLAAQGVKTAGRRLVEVTAPATPEAARWEGYGTALRPAFEPAILAMKPFPGTFADNALAHGVGGLAIAASRIHSEGANTTREGGRWPANLAIDEDAARQLDRANVDPVSRYFHCPKVGAEERGDLVHPTMKPGALTEYLARLLLPPAQDGRPRRLVVPFSGVGSEMLGGLRAGWDYVHGIELDPDFAAAAQSRLQAWQDGPVRQAEDLTELPLFAGLEAAG